MNLKINFYYNHIISTSLNVVLLLHASFFIINSGFGRISLYVATILWILEGRFKEKLSKLWEQKVVFCFLMTLILMIVSLSLSDSYQDGFWDKKYETGFNYIVKKPFLYFLTAIYISTSLKKEFILPLLYAFLIQIVYMCLYSYGIYFGFLGGNAKDPAIFTHRIFFSIALNMGIFGFLSLYFSTFSNKLKIFYCLCIALLVFDLFLVGSRLGQFSFIFSSFFITIYLLARIKMLKFYSIIVFLSLILAFLFTMYTLNHNFKTRINQGVSDIQKVILHNDYSTSWGTRIGYVSASLSLLTQNSTSAIFGLGMGEAKKDFTEFLSKESVEKTSILKHTHIHNQFLQLWVDGGIFSVIFYLLIFYYLLFSFQGTLLIKLITIAFCCTFIFTSTGDIIYHRADILGLFALFLGFILANVKRSNIKDYLMQTS